MNTLTAITNQGDFYYPIDNTGTTDISFVLQQIFDELSQIENISVTLIFEPAGRNIAFPSGETPWSYGTTKFSFSHINFVGYNNTDVDTAVSEETLLILGN
ncbi:MAG: hypothetical protein R3Y24_08605 [Eubacteriales bacterium]